MNNVQKYDKVLFNIPIPLYFYSNILGSIYHLKKSGQVMNKRKLPNKVIEGIFRK